MHAYTYMDQDLDRLANQIKETLIAFLVNDGLLNLNQKEYENFCASYVVVLARRGVFGRLWDKARGFTNTQGDYIITIAKTPIREPSASSPPVVRLVKDEDE